MLARWHDTIFQSPLLTTQAGHERYNQLSLHRRALQTMDMCVKGKQTVFLV